ncbi:MAG TPA: nucleoside-diphosphate sugar epimerase [Gammaproteobacteria bacterium]|nr:nucleoside-diphosphate sugar epimerase [Gammaproteobacteria bacterium]
MNQSDNETASCGTPSPEAPPRVWLVTGYRAGERSQVLALAEGLGWPFEARTLSYRKAEFRTSLFRGSDLRGIRLEASSALEPPWPDLVITAGMRNEPVGRWIREQAGGATRLVHIGRPWARPDRFDLVITTPQYRLPEHPRVLQNAMPLHRVTAERLAAEADRFRPRFEDLPPPYIGVILGGNSGPYTLGPKTTASILRRASRLATARGASLLISTSARTPKSAIDAVEDSVSVPHYLYRWRPDDTDNPYFGILGLSEELVVTADSISMLGEAIATGKPVYMAELGGAAYPMRPDHPGETDFRFTALTYSWLMRFGPRFLSRDLRLVHRRLLQEGRVVWLGERFGQRNTEPLHDLERAVQRVRALFNR